MCKSALRDLGRTIVSDPLDKETSVSIALTETGVKAKAKSRFVAAVDRFGGNLVELMNAPMERIVSRQRAITAGESELIKAAAQFGVERLNHDPSFAERSAETYLKGVFEKQQNKDRVLLEALEDLRQDPPNEVEAEAGDPTIEEQVLGRLEYYASGATTEALQQMWGRVLSAEVRAPGTFSLKVLRVVDEIDKDTAALFERVCSFSIEDAIPVCLTGTLPFDERSRLMMAGLLMDPGVSGHIRHFWKMKFATGDEHWAVGSKDEAVSFPPEPKPQLEGPFFVSAGPLTASEKDGFAMPIYLLTDAGAAIAKIFPKNDAFSRYVEALKTRYPEIKFARYRRHPGNRYEPVGEQT